MNCAEGSATTQSIAATGSTITVDMEVEKRERSYAAAKLVAVPEPHLGRGASTGAYVAFEKSISTNWICSDEPGWSEGRKR